jgi:hypothetical protein
MSGNDPYATAFHMGKIFKAFPIQTTRTEMPDNLLERSAQSLDIDAHFSLSFYLIYANTIPAISPCQSCTPSGYSGMWGVFQPAYPFDLRLQTCAILNLKGEETNGGNG